MLRDGSLAKKIADAYAQREALAKRRDPVTGVSEFPNIQETPLQLEQPDLLAAYRAATDRLKVARGADGGAMAKALDALKSAKPGGLAEAALAAASAGATFGQIAQTLKGGETRVQALPRHRLAERFEALRDASDAYLKKTGARPKIFLPTSARSPSTRRALPSPKTSSRLAASRRSAMPVSGRRQLRRRLQGSGARIAILCSADPIYEEMAEPVAALKAAGCEYLFLAGAGEKKDAYKAAGIDDFIFMGGDVLQTTRSTLARLGVI